MGLALPRYRVGTYAWTARFRRYLSAFTFRRTSDLTASFLRQFRSSDTSEVASETSNMIISPNLRRELAKPSSFLHNVSRLSREMARWFGLRNVARATESPEEADGSVVVLVIEHHHDLPLSGDAHPGFELAILVAGRQERHAPGYSTDMVPGDVFLSPAWEPHGWRNLTDYTKVINIHFLPEFLGNAEFAGESWLSMFACSYGERPRVQDDEMRARTLAIAQELSADAVAAVAERWPLDAPGDVAGRVVWTKRSIGRETAGLPLAWEDETRLTTLRLLLLLFRGWTHRDKATPGRLARPSDLAQIMPAIKRAIPGEAGASRVDMHDAARACHLSPTTFRRLFRKTMGVTFGRFELQQRTAMAERLLLRTDLPLVTTAGRCGFTNLSHFHRTFKTMYGETPGQYRNAARKHMV